MNRTYNILSALVGVTFFLIVSAGAVEKQDVNWDLFNKNLVKALKSGNDGLQRSAMMRIIQHAENVNVDNAVYDIMRIYLDHRDLKVRQLALVTLHKLENKWAIAYLKKHVKFEKSPLLRKQIYAILNEYAQKQAFADQDGTQFAQKQ